MLTDSPYVHDSDHFVVWTFFLSQILGKISHKQPSLSCFILVTICLSSFYLNISFAVYKILAYILFP